MRQLALRCACLCSSLALGALPLVLALAGPVRAQSGSPPPLPSQSGFVSPTIETAGLRDALQRFPALIVGGNVQRAGANEAVPPSCPAAGSRVEQKGGPTLEFLGIANGNKDLCHMRMGPAELNAWFGIWGDTWPGADFADRALQRIMHSKTGDVVGFDTVAERGVAQWHDLIRNDGVEDIQLLGKTYRALKLAHYREGYDGNSYRSVATLWVDVLSGLPVYATYQHIAGRPELDSPLIPTAIVPAP